MRYMWVVNPLVTPTTVIDWLKSEDAAYVERIMHFEHRCAWVFITTWSTYVRAGNRDLTDDGYCWGVTSCNKQYVNYESTGKFIGCMKQVTRQEGINNKELNDSFYIVDPDSHMIWTPVMENPNRLVPTRDGKRDTWPEQTRPWPLRSETYEEWRDRIN